MLSLELHGAGSKHAEEVQDEKGPNESNDPISNAIQRALPRLMIEVCGFEWDAVSFGHFVRRRWEEEKEVTASFYVAPLFYIVLQHLGI